MKQIMLCAISSLSCGKCAEDCTYCTQNINANTKINRYKIKTPKEIVAEAKIASANHALGFCLVTSGAGLDSEKTEKVARIARAVAKECPELMLIACNGIADTHQLKELKNAGIFSYNHNLETSREFYPKICTTHSWDDRYQTNLNAKEVGLELCCGGIYGLGESENDRSSFRKSLASLNPFSSPINFFINVNGLGLNPAPLSINDGFKIIDDSVKSLPNTRIMIAAGREKLFGKRQYEIFDHGVAAIVLGDYLTTKGETVSKDISELKNRGFSFATKCH